MLDTDRKFLDTMFLEFRELPLIDGETSVKKLGAFEFLCEVSHDNSYYSNTDWDTTYTVEVSLKSENIIIATCRKRTDHESKLKDTFFAALGGLEEEVKSLLKRADIFRDLTT